MPDFKKIADTIAKGMFQDDWNKTKKDEMAIKGEQQRQLLAANADTRAGSADARAAAEEGRRAEENTYGIGRRSAKEEMEAAALKAAGLNNEQIELALQGARAKKEAYDLAGGAQGEANETIAERRRREEDQKIEQSRLGLEGRRTAMAEELGALEGMTREEQLKESQRKNRFGSETYTGAVEAENYNNSEEARDERRRAANLSGLRNAGAEGPIYDSIANDLMAIDAKRKQRRQSASAPPQKPVKERAGAAASAFKPRKDR